MKILELGQADARVIPWEEVSGVERGAFKPGKPAAREVPSAVPSGPGTVRLHIESPIPVDLYKHLDSYGHTSGGHFIALDTPTQVCTSPCDANVDGGHGEQFSVVGEQAVESVRFSVAGPRGEQVLDVSPGSRGLRSGGAVATALGLTGVGVGTILAVAGAVGNGTPPQVEMLTGQVLRHGTPSTMGGIETAGFVALGVGATALVGGIVALVAARTTIHLHPAGVAAAKPAEAKPRYWAGEF